MSTADKIFTKKSSSTYSEKQIEGVHTKTGMPVLNPFTGQPAAYASQREHAKAGALVKHLACRAGVQAAQLSDHEKDLLIEASEDVWAGEVSGEHYTKIAAPGRVKALLDDVTSGGLEITPTWFDDAVITFPLLTGELLPHVDLRDVPRGRRIESASIGNPEVSWGQGDNTTVDLFNTASLVAPIDSTVFGCAVAIEVGRDFLADAAVDVGGQLTAVIGQRMQAELDRVIGTGNGTTEPEGIFTASGLTTVATDNDTTGPPTVNDFLELMFSVDKQFRNGAFRPAFVTNDTSYQRSRAIKIDTAETSTDQRPALAPLVDVNKYSTLGWPHLVQNDVTNSQGAFVALAKYRLYRRAGLQLQFVDGGKELARKNLVLLVARARFAGKLMDTNAAAKWTDGQN